LYLSSILPSSQGAGTLEIDKGAGPMNRHHQQADFALSH